MRKFLVSFVATFAVIGPLVAMGFYLARRVSGVPEDLVHDSVVRERTHRNSQSNSTPRNDTSLETSAADASTRVANPVEPVSPPEPESPVERAECPKALTTWLQQLANDDIDCDGTWELIAMYDAERCTDKDGNSSFVIPVTVKFHKPFKELPIHLLAELDTEKNTVTRGCYVTHGGYYPPNKNIPNFNDRNYRNFRGTALYDRLLKMSGFGSSLRC